MMVQPTPREIEELVLAYEDLAADERAEVDRILAGRPDLAARLRWHREREEAARQPLAVADSAWDEDTLTESEVAAQKESLRRTLAAALPATRFPRARVLGWGLPLAAILAVLVLLPTLDGPDSLLRELQVVTFATEGGTTRGVDPVRTVRGGELRTGDAFALEFHLAQDAHVVVFHLDPAGVLTPVHPASFPAAGPLLAGDRTHRIPPADAGETWILGGETGTETWFVAADPAWPDSTALLRVTATGSTRASVVEEVVRQLEALFVQVDVHEFQHVD